MMMLELFLALIAGLVIGTITGLTPGIHTNLITAILASGLIFKTFKAPPLMVFIVSLSITHTFLDFIPSVFLGAPNEDNFLSVLPGHEMLKEGNAYEAVVLTLYGSLMALVIIFAFTPVFILIVPLIYDKLQISLPILLIFVSTYLILRENKVLLSMIIFLLAGILGFFTLNLPIEQPLLPLLTGLFGTSAIILSLKNKTNIPPQQIIPIRKIHLTKKELLNASIGAIISAPLCSYLPGIGSGHAAVIGSEIVSQTRKGFVFLVGGINTIVLGLSFTTLYVIGKTRSGAAVAIDILKKELMLSDLFLILVVVAFAGVLSFFWGIFIAKQVTKKINHLDYKKLSIFVLVVILIVNLIFTNLYGLIVLVTSTALGIFTILSGARRINLMGSLLIPTIIFYVSLFLF